MAVTSSSVQPKLREKEALEFATHIIETVCQVSARSEIPLQTSIASKSARVRRLVAAQDTPAAFDWMLESFNFQGISDQVAGSYLDAHGCATWRQLKAQLSKGPSCDLLGSYWNYEGCRFDKTRRLCRHPEILPTCPVPTHPLRNGHLNQTAFSFFLFVRDIAQSDLFAWIDDQLRQARSCGQDQQEALVGPMRHIYGVADKVLTMTLSSLLMADPAGYPQWFEVGSQMIVVDRLVHNFLTRTGILSRFDAGHAYGPQCYKAGGCADLLRTVSAGIDAKQFSPTYPSNFPRYTQHALWRYCAADAINICNGNKIDDRGSCKNEYCILYSKCDRIAVKRP
jgi:hypothetical protein